MNSFAGIGAAALAAAVLAGGAAQGGSVTVDALSLWTANGSVVATGPDKSVFAGQLGGPYLVDAGQGPVPAGEISCVGIVVAQTSTGRQSAEAECRLTADDGAVGFGRLSCEGLRLVGCAGPFEFTGGEGRLEGLSGGGRVVLRRMGTGLEQGAGAVEETGFGIASWKGLTITLPDPQ